MGMPHGDQAKTLPRQTVRPRCVAWVAAAIDPHWYGAAPRARITAAIIASAPGRPHPATGLRRHTPLKRHVLSACRHCALVGEAASPAHAPERAGDARCSRGESCRAGSVTRRFTPRHATQHEVPDQSEGQELVRASARGQQS
ncbi:hypothetical protein CYMTET_8989 [Cymbomonas tetramitiformis]|uniref:Uncharacterized protein n=1 Tax=Cymbomonas tetramitiformis TaxID=36881 RepID=A0AAE0LFG9_9CHLO|nr:hypothetical protein CYMTET_8989 [Cymbomonas tetramitiformis]